MGEFVVVNPDARRNRLKELKWYVLRLFHRA
jgi:hypothetical protein